MASAGYVHHHSRRLLSQSILVLVFLLLAFMAYFSWQSWKDAVNEESNQLRTVTDLGGKVMDSYFAQLEATLQGLGKDLAGTQKQLNLDHAYALVKSFQTSHSELASVILMRADGQLLMTGNTPYSREMPRIGTEPSFRHFRDELQITPFVIGRPVTGRFDESWVIPARYGVKDQSGKLSYIISANLPINLIQLYLADSEKPGATTFRLVRDDGYIVGIYPEPDAAKLNETFGSPVSGALGDHLRANSAGQAGQADGASIAANNSRQLVRHLQHYPLALFAQMPESEIKAVWWRKVRVPYLLVTLMLAGMLVVRKRGFRRHEVWSQEQRREMLRHNYEHALLERSSNEIYMFDADTLLFTYANDYALSSLGCSLEELQQRTFLSLHPEMNTETFGTLIAPLRRGEQESVKYQTVQARADGSTYPVEINLQLFTTDVRSGCLAIVNDITALRHAEENLAKFNAPAERRAARR